MMIACSKTFGWSFIRNSLELYSLKFLNILQVKYFDNFEIKKYHRLCKLKKDFKNKNTLLNPFMLSSYSEVPITGNDCYIMLL